MPKQPMERIVFLTFRNQQVLLADCSDCTPEELAAVIDDVPEHVTQEPLGIGAFARRFQPLKIHQGNPSNILRLPPCLTAPTSGGRRGCSRRTFPKLFTNRCAHFPGARFPLRDPQRSLGVSGRRTTPTTGTARVEASECNGG